MLETRIRKLTAAERRLLRARVLELDRSGRRRPRFLLAVAAALFGILWALTLAASDAPWQVVTVFWLLVGTGLTFWIFRSFRVDLATFDMMRDAIHSALRADSARVTDVTARAFVAFEEFEDEGACYAFEVDGERLLFLSGQQYYESAKFPSLEFSVVHVLDEGQRVVDELIHKGGPKAKPERIIPAESKLRMTLPEDGQTIRGTLSRLEELLGDPAGE